VIGLADLLRFYQAAGVEYAVSDTPFNALAAPVPAQPAAIQQPAAKPALIQAAEVKPAPQAAPMQPQMPAPSPAPASAGGAISRESFDKRLADAREQAAQAQDLADLKQRIAAYSGCSLKLTARNTCIADGSAPHPLMLIGEGPGAEEDRQALPFVGPAGQLLTLMLTAIGFGRESCAAKTEGAAAPKPEHLAYITNAVFWRPPGNRNPTDEEIALCRPFLERQIELVQPKILISLGGVAAGALLGRKQSILRLRGQWQTYRTTNGAEIPLMPSLHPAFLLRSPLQKKSAWADFLEVKMRLKTAGVI